QRAQPAPAPARPAVARPTLPPRGEDRAVEPMPPTRRAEPARRAPPPPERSYDRADLREPPREGGRARALILVALLGGAALLGGIYFGGGMSDFGTGAPEEQAEDISPTPDPTSSEFAEALDEPVGVPIDANSAAPAPRERVERREVEPQPRREPEPATTVARNEEPEPPTPAPRTSWGAGGPVSLSPGSAGTDVASNTTNPAGSNPALSTAPPAPVSIPASTTRATPPAPRGAVVWSQRPSARRLADLYPSRALQAGV